MAQPDLILFAKQPVPGQVKTRLQPAYSPEQAAEIAAFLIHATVKLATSCWPGDVYLYTWPDTEYWLFHELADRFRIRLDKQSGKDLGKRMFNALSDGIARQGSAAIMGCDVPHCPRNVINQANHWLVHGRNVIGPTVDGGYYFLGLQEIKPKLFQEIAWGDRDVFQSTLAQGKAMGIEFATLTELRDLDTADDLWLVAQKYEPLRQFSLPTN